MNSDNGSVVEFFNPGSNDQLELVQMMKATNDLLNKIGKKKAVVDMTVDDDEDNGPVDVFFGDAVINIPDMEEPTLEEQANTEVGDGNNEEDSKPATQPSPTKFPPGQGMGIAPTTILPTQPTPIQMTV